MKKYIVILLLLSASTIVFAQQEIIVHTSDGNTQSLYTSSVEDIRFSNSSALFYMNDNSADRQIAIADIDSLTFDYKVVPPDDGETVYIHYTDSGVETVNPYESAGISIAVKGSDVSISAATGIAGIHYYLSGYTADGSFSIDSDTDVLITLEDAQLSSLSSPVINIGKAVTATINLQGENQLADNAGNAKNNAVAGKGDLVFEGTGSLTLQANKKNGISSDLGITINGGDIRIDSGIDDAKAIKADQDIVINGGSIGITVSGNQSKGISGKLNTYLNGGSIDIIASGKTVLESAGNGYDPSYCSAIKSDGDIYVSPNSSLTIELTNTNNGGKGLTADGNIRISGGAIHITTAGDGEVYTDENGDKDSFSSCCIKSDGDMSITGGNIYCNSSGKAGKGIAADGTLTIGEEGQTDFSNLYLEVKTSGERFLVSSGTGGGWPPGGNDSSDYANPKAVKSEGDLTIHGGTIRIYCTQTDEGGEGLESKATLTVNDGDIHIEAYDDCINAANHIQLNGGNIYCYSSGNDGIDSNGTITIAGGFIISKGTRSPEEGFDCDQNRFAITGGITIGTGGATSTPTNSACEQYCVVYNNATAGNHIAIKNADGDYILLYQLPTFSGNSGGGGPGGGGGNSMTVLFSDPALAQGSYTLLYGGSISGGTTVNGYNTGGTYSGGSTKSFTISNNKVITVR